MSKRKLVEISQPFFVDPDYKAGLTELGLTSIDTVFSFHAGSNLTKNNLADYRSRVQFEIGSPPTTLFLKRYDSPPLTTQLKNWFWHRRKQSCAVLELQAAAGLAAEGINTPKTIAHGEQWGTFLEKRSFIITEKIPAAESLERRLPDCFTSAPTAENLRLRRDFMARLAAFIRKLHQTTYRHRDLYLSHIFYGDNGRFYLIDLARAFRPKITADRFRRKDIAQLHYSAPATSFSNTDRLRFFLAYTNRRKLTREDKAFIRKVINRANRMARHDTKHGRPVPFAI
ncbi:MAG: lipopolysaccharide kinase InaA family protein [Planctomycetota bacterium]|jgi:hypothetical protein